jgi:hypothetical protein
MTEVNGCDLCGDFPVELGAKCHPTAPLRVEMTREDELVLYCYLPECNREVARFRVEVTR